MICTLWELHHLVEFIPRSENWQKVEAGCGLLLQPATTSHYWRIAKLAAHLQRSSQLFSILFGIVNMQSGNNGKQGHRSKPCNRAHKKSVLQPRKSELHHLKIALSFEKELMQEQSLHCDTSFSTSTMSGNSDTSGRDEGTSLAST